MKNRNDLPPEREAFGDLVDAQPLRVRELWQWSLVMLLNEQRKVRIVEEHTADGREYYTIASIVVEVFSLVKPNASNELFEQMMETVREIASEDADDSW
jgi:hypothetical protein